MPLTFWDLTMLRPVLFVYRLRTNNTGDHLSCPLLYFGRSYPTAIRMEVHLPRGGRLDPVRRAKLRFLRDSAQAIILGGGGLIGNTFHAEDLGFWAGGRTPTIIWGAGHNSEGIDAHEIGHPQGLATSTPDESHYAQVIPCQSIGIRGWGPGFTWVPCASCMHPALQLSRSDNGQVVFAMHLSLRKDEEALRTILEGAANDYGLVFNDEPMNVIIGKLRDARYVVTNSYHLAYWATLLGKRVVVIGGGTKVKLLKHAATIATPTTWQAALESTIAYPDALEECRDRNRDFNASVLDRFIKRRTRSGTRPNFVDPVEARTHDFEIFKQHLPPITKSKVPKIVHFIFDPSPRRAAKLFNIMHCIAIQSVAARFNPEQIFLHFGQLPSGDFFERIKSLVTLCPLSSAENDSLQGECGSWRRSSIIRLRKLYQMGGVYLDLDTVTVRSFEPFLDNSFTIGVLGHTPVLGFCNAVMAAAPGDAFVGEWLNRYEQGNVRRWLDSTVQLPYLMWRSGKHSINVESFDKFNLPLWDEKGMKIMFERRHHFEGAYCHHLWQSISGPRYFPDEAYPNAVARLRRMNSTYSRLAAEFL